MPVDPRAITNPVDPGLSPQLKAEKLYEMAMENAHDVGAFLARLDDRLGTRSNWNIKAREKTVAKARRPGVLERNPWFRVEHVRDAFRFRTRVSRLSQIVEAVEFTRTHGGLAIVKVDLGKMIEPKGFGWRLVVVDVRCKNGQLAEWQLVLDEIDEVNEKECHLLFEKHRGAAKLSSQGLKDQKQSRKRFDEAMLRSLERQGLGPWAKFSDHWEPFALMSCMCFRAQCPLANGWTDCRGRQGCLMVEQIVA